jgi:hypothetical protein
MNETQWDCVSLNWLGMVARVSCGALITDVMVYWQACNTFELTAYETAVVPSALTHSGGCRGCLGQDCPPKSLNCVSP